MSAQTMGMAVLEDLQDQAAEHRSSGGAGPLPFSYVRGSVTRVNTVNSSGGGSTGAAARGSGDSSGVQTVSGVDITLHGASASGGPPETISCAAFVNASGPFLGALHDTAMAGITDGLQRKKGRGDRTDRGGRLPLTNELHAKVVFRDALCVLPRDSPMMILDDDQVRPFTPVEIDSCIYFYLRLPLTLCLFN